jgi:hypothetical protein
MATHKDKVKGILKGTPKHRRQVKATAKVLPATTRTGHHHR